MKKTDNEGGETTDQKEIQRIFEIFYTKLYLKKDMDNMNIKQYLEKHLEKLKVEKTEERIKQILNEGITKEEVENAIVELKVNKPLVQMDIQQFFSKY